MPVSEHAVMRLLALAYSRSKMPLRHRLQRNVLHKSSNRLPISRKDDDKLAVCYIRLACAGSRGFHQQYVKMLSDLVKTERLSNLALRRALDDLGIDANAKLVLND